LLQDSYLANQIEKITKGEHVIASLLGMNVNAPNVYLSSL